MSSDKLIKTKELAEIFLKDQLVMIESLSELKTEEVKEFNSWYHTHPLYQVIPRMLESIKHLRIDKKV